MSENLPEIRYLYKYCRLEKFAYSNSNNEEITNTRLKKIITDNDLYFSCPADFNDPYDCNIPEGTDFPDENIRFLILKNNKRFDKLMKEIQKNPKLLPEHLKQYIKESGVCCFSKLYDSILMWAHYANSHTGICLKFDTTKDSEFFKKPLYVNYSEKPPFFDYHGKIQEEIEKFVITKFKTWQYEEEVRIFKTATEISNNNKNGKRVFQFKSEALQEIIFGVRTTEKDMEKIEELCENSGKNHVKFSKMKLKEGIYYGLEKVDL